MRKYTLVITYVFVICIYHIASVQGNTSKSATTPAKPTTSLTNVKQQDEDDDDFSDDDEPEPKATKPAAGVQKPVQTSPVINAAKPATAAASKVQGTVNKATTTVAKPDTSQTNAKQQDEDEDDFSDDDEPEPKATKPAAGLQKPAQTAPVNNAAKPATAAASKVQGTFDKATTTVAKPDTSQTNAKQQDEDDDDFSDDDKPEPKATKPAAGVQKPVQTALPNNAAKPAAATQGKAKQDNEDEGDSDEQPNKPTQRPVHATVTNNVIESNTKLPQKDEQPKKDSQTTTNNKKSYDEIENASDKSHHVYYKDHYKTRDATKMDKHDYYAGVSNPYTDKRKEYRHLILYGPESNSRPHASPDRIHSRHSTKPISINIPIRIY